MKYLIILLTLSFSACTTIIPSTVNSNNASFDGNEQNSGIISTTMDGFKVTTHFRDRYNALIAVYGDAKQSDGSPLFTPALIKDFGLTSNVDGTYTMTKQAMVFMVQMSEMKRRAFKP